MSQVFKRKCSAVELSFYEGEGRGGSAVKLAALPVTS